MKFSNPYFAIVSDVEIPRRVISSLISDVNDLNSFFYIKKKYFEVFLVKSREEFDRIMGGSTKQWETGFFNNGVIFIFHPEFMEKETSHKKEDFYHILKHELVHLYFREKYKVFIKWIDEGLATYLSQDFILNNEEVLIKEHIPVEQLFGEGVVHNFPKIYYKQVCSMVCFLIRNCGKNAFLRFLDELSREEKKSMKNFKVLFFKFFKFKFDNLENEWLRHIKKNSSKTA